MIQALLGAGQIGLGAYSMLQGRKAGKKARKEQKAYLAAAMAEYDKLAAMFKPGGDYGKRLQEDLRKQGELDVGRNLQSRIQAGLGGTSYANVYGQYQQNVARPARMRLEDFLTDKYAQVINQKANLLSGVQVSGPSAGNMYSAGEQIGQGIGTLAGLFGGGGGTFKSELVKSVASKPKIDAPTTSPLDYIKKMFNWGKKD